MAITKLRGKSQIINGSIEREQLKAGLALPTTQLEDGASFLKRDGSVGLTSDFNAGGFKLTSIGNGVAATDAVTKGQLDAAINALPNPMEYKGLFDASAGALPASGDLGDTYIVSVTGTIATVTYKAGTAIVFNKAVAKTGGTLAADWDNPDRQDQVLTVAGRVGNIELFLADITDISATVTEVNYLAGVASNIQAQIDAKAATSYVDAQDTAIEAAAKSYTDTREVAIRADISSTALTDAKAYTDSKVPVFVDDELVSGTVNQVNKVFTVVGTPVEGSLKLYKNGSRLHGGVGNDFTISGNTITVAVEHTPDFGDVLVADYRTN